MTDDRIKWFERIPGYHYYDTPEGEDCLKKTFYMVKAGLLTGVMVSSLDVLAISKPVGFPAIAARYAKISFPLMAVGATFGASCCSLAYYRQKDDTLNYFFGGFSAGCVAGACARSGTFGTAAALIMGLSSFAYKTMIENGLWDLQTRQVPAQWGGIWSIKYDFTYTPNHTRGWKKSEDEDLSQLVDK